MLNSHEADACCGAAIGDALLSGALDQAERWTHEECGMEWRPELFGTIRHWKPHPIALIVR